MLLDWKRRVFALYAQVRDEADPERGWRDWCAVREDLFASHPQSPAPGVRNGRLVLDFNFSYNPSCAYDRRWVCPLAPAGNRLTVAVKAGERTPSGRD